MSAKNPQQYSHTLREVSAYVIERPANGTVPSAFITNFGTYKNLGSQKGVPAFDQPLTVTNDPYADLGVSLTNVSRDAVTMKLNLGQFDDDTIALVFSGGGNAEVPIYDLVLDYKFQRGARGLQLVFPDALLTAIGTYGPESGSAASVDITFTSDSNPRINGFAYRPLLQPAA